MKGDRGHGLWAPYVAQYRRGEWRAPIFRDMILADARQFGRKVTMLDIGCGKGFDGCVALQESLSSESGRYVGVEPDTAVLTGEHIHELHRCRFEEAPLEPGSVDLAFATMVLEHIPEPGRFWQQLWQVLAAGGVFWGFTMDRRHFICALSRWAERLEVKDFYLKLIRRRSEVAPYDNYPTYYRANTPRRIEKDARCFHRCDFVSFSRVGQLDYYVPRLLRPLSHLVDRIMIGIGGPGSLLAVRIEKQMETNASNHVELSGTIGVRPAAAAEH